MPQSLRDVEYKSQPPWDNKTLASSSSSRVHFITSELLSFAMLTTSSLLLLSSLLPLALAKDWESPAYTGTATVLAV